jgi:hypothetical protein
MTIHTDTVYVLRQVETNEHGRPMTLIAASELIEKLKTYALEYEFELQQIETEEEEIRLAGEVEWLVSPEDPRILFWPVMSGDLEYQISPVTVV